MGDARKTVSAYAQNNAADLASLRLTSDAGKWTRQEEDVEELRQLKKLLTPLHNEVEELEHVNIKRQVSNDITTLRDLLTAAREPTVAAYVKTSVKAALDVVEDAEVATLRTRLSTAEQNASEVPTLRRQLSEAAPILLQVETLNEQLRTAQGAKAEVVTLRSRLEEAQQKLSKMKTLENDLETAKETAASIVSLQASLERVRSHNETLQQELERTRTQARQASSTCAFKDEIVLIQKNAIIRYQADERRQTKRIETMGADVKKTNAEIDQMREANKAKDQELDACTATIGEKENYIRTLQSQNQEASSKYDALEEQKKAQERGMDDSVARIENLQRSLEDKSNRVTELTTNVETASCKFANLQQTFEEQSQALSARTLELNKAQEALKSSRTTIQRQTHSLRRRKRQAVSTKRRHQRVWSKAQHLALDLQRRFRSMKDVHRTMRRQLSGVQAGLNHSMATNAVLRAQRASAQRQVDRSNLQLERSRTCARRQKSELNDCRTRLERTTQSNSIVRTHNARFKATVKHLQVIITDRQRLLNRAHRAGRMLRAARGRLTQRVARSKNKAYWLVRFLRGVVKCLSKSNAVQTQEIAVLKGQRQRLQMQSTHRAGMLAFTTNRLLLNRVIVKWRARCIRTLMADRNDLQDESRQRADILAHTLVRSRILEAALKNQRSDLDVAEAYLADTVSENVALDSALTTCRFNLEHETDTVMELEKQLETAQRRYSGLTERYRTDTSKLKLQLQDLQEDAGADVLSLEGALSDSQEYAEDLWFQLETLELSSAEREVEYEDAEMAAGIVLEAKAGYISKLRKSHRAVQEERNAVVKQNETLQRRMKELKIDHLERLHYQSTSLRQEQDDMFTDLQRRYDQAQYQITMISSATLQAHVLRRLSAGMALHYSSQCEELRRQHGELDKKLREQYNALEQELRDGRSAAIDAEVQYALASYQKRLSDPLKQILGWVKSLEDECRVFVSSTENRTKALLARQRFEETARLQEIANMMKQLHTSALQAHCRYAQRINDLTGSIAQPDTRSQRLQ